jgi:hypothetical protein
MGDENINEKIGELLDNYYYAIAENKNNFSSNNDGTITFDEFQKKEILIKHNYIEKVKIVLRWKM